MKKESLEEAFNLMIKSIDDSNINTVDKVELFLNLKHFLDPKKYEKNIKILRLNQKSKFEKDD